MDSEMAKNEIADIINNAVEEVAPPELNHEKPRLLIDRASPDRTVRSVRDTLARAGDLYDRGVPVRLVTEPDQGKAVAHPMFPDNIIMRFHELARPYEMRERNGLPYEKNIQLPHSIATMYLAWQGHWKLPPLNGIASAPLLSEDGTIHSGAGYDPASGMWQEDVPDLAEAVPERPTREQAATAVMTIREVFKTFCFSDAATIPHPVSGVPIVDTSVEAGRDEASFLVGLLTAVCRPSLELAPGLLISAAPMSGAGAGKGLLARCTSLVAFGREPYAVTAGSNVEEMEKRIGAELIGGGPTLFLDNLNNQSVKSDLLASALTERPARVRVLGKSQNVELNASALVILTGNGLSVSEDLARRFIAIELDPKMENPESRNFPSDIKAEVRERRAEILAALLTIWRWGRQADDLPKGKPLGNFGQWARWVRDPLLALGCKDPVDRVADAKSQDARRQVVNELFSTWWQHHGDQPMHARDLHEEIKQLLDPHNRSRQSLASRLQRYVGTRAAGFVLERDQGGQWGAATYRLMCTEEAGNHRAHRDHELASVGDMAAGNGQDETPMVPMVAMLAGPTSYPAAKGRRYEVRI